MFEQTFIECARTDARRPWPVAASFAGQTALVAAILAIPLFQTARLAWTPPNPLVFMPPKPMVVQIVRAQAATTQTASPTRPLFRPVFAAPLRIPSRIVTAPDPDPGAFVPQGAVGVYVDPLPGIGATMPVVRGPQAAAATVVRDLPVPSSIKVSGGVQAAKLLRQVKPAYPALARAARMSGTVRLQAIIAADGKIRNLQLVSGPPLLVQSALEAVRQWVYEPTLLNNVPVEVITSIEVNFLLNQ